MSATIALQLVNRAPKTPIKRLPATLELPQDATVEDAKKIIARQTGISDFNRVGLFDPSTNKTLKNRLAKIGEEAGVKSSGKVLVKDLGPQMSWRAVFVVEYFGPILFHAVVPLIRPYLYIVPPFNYKNETETPMTRVQWLLFAMFMVHFAKRELETMFVHRFSANTMPIKNIFRNSFFYWATAGLAAAVDIYAPGNLADRVELGLIDYVGIALFAMGEVLNFRVHMHLTSLRRPGGTERGIPNCVGSSLVTCPNYMFEIMAWVGVILVSRSWAVVLFISLGTKWMIAWSKEKETALRREFGDRYKKKTYGVIPGVV